MLIPFLIAFFVATLVCDLVFWRSGNGDWFAASQWLLGAGIVMALLAAVVGLIDVLGEARIRALREVWWHAGGNLLLVLIQAWSWYMRYTEVMPPGLILSVVAVLLMLFTGWMGRQMVYRDHVGVADRSNRRSGSVPFTTSAVSVVGRAGRPGGTAVARMGAAFAQADSNRQSSDRYGSVSLRVESKNGKDRKPRATRPSSLPGPAAQSMVADITNH